VCGSLLVSVVTCFASGLAVIRIEEQREIALMVFDVMDHRLVWAAVAWLIPEEHAASWCLAEWMGAQDLAAQSASP